MKVSVLIVAAAAMLAFACSEEQCTFTTRCNGAAVEGCHGSTISPEEYCTAPNECTELAEGFAACVVPNRSCADGGFGTCFQNGRLVCSSDSRQPGVSWVQGEPCGSQTCYFDGGTTGCVP